MRNIGYEERLKKWSISSLEDRHVRGDLIQMYKSVNGLDEIKWENDRVNLSTEGVLTRAHMFGIKRETFKSRNRNDFCKQVSTRHTFFYNRLAPTWNFLPETIVKAPTLNSFKKQIDDRYKRNGRYS